jgi:hypothetical protein
MVTHVLSYDVLVGGVMLYRLKIILDLWEKTIHY